LPPNIEINDLINAGVLGLMDAIEKFEPSRGVKFKTYAELRIRGAMIDSLRELDWAPRSLRKKSKELSKVSQKLQQELGREVSDQEICAEMGIELDELYKLEDQLTGLSIGSFYDASRRFGEEDSDAESLINYYPDDGGPTVDEAASSHPSLKQDPSAILFDDAARAFNSMVDGLRERDGQTLTELCEAIREMTRFGVMKHLAVLKEAHLVVTERHGRSKHHYLNPVPIRQIHDRWISKYAGPWVSALTDLKHRLEYLCSRSQPSPRSTSAPPPNGCGRR
jgi:RNA polymerase sigma factor (sigma-70 family)